MWSLESITREWPFIRPILDIIDVLLISYIFYRVFLAIRGTRAIQILKGLGILIMVSLVAQLMGLRTASWVFRSFWENWVIAFAVLFLPEIRRAIARIGVGIAGRSSSSEVERAILEVSRAVRIMSRKKIGAILAFEGMIGLRSYVETGTKIDAEVSSDLLLSIFSPGVPLHDGAVIIRNWRIAAAGCILPLSEEEHPGLGARHRAAIGLSEETDALVLVVSEESGNVSLASGGNISEVESVFEIEDLLKEMLLKKRVGR